MPSHNLAVASCNVRGIQSKNLDILCLQETRLLNNNGICDVKKIWGNSTSLFSVGEDRADGIAILFYTSDVKIIKVCELIPGRLMYADIFMFGSKIRIINLYTAQDRTKKTKLSNKLKNLLYVGYHIIVCGDFNTITDNIDSSSSKPNKITRVGHILKIIMSENKLNDSFRILYPNKIDYTRFDTSCNSRIDRIYTSEKVTVLSYITKLLIESDHLTVITHIKINESEQCKHFWKMNTKILNIVKNNIYYIEQINRMKSILSEKEIMWLIICITKYKLWITRCRMTIDQVYVSSDNVFKQIICELRRRRTLDIKN
uniref:exodeoxyribonuclease III n=1 Tax=Astyanax mexicanus TaxID=7994 RepID=A0A3B1JYF2_ASTMX